MDDNFFEGSFGEEYLIYDEKYGSSLIGHRINYQEDTILNSIQDQIIENKDLSAACFLAHSFRYRVYRMQQLILESQSLKYLVFFARYVPNVDIAAFQKLLLASSSTQRIKYLCQFACFVPGADIKKISRIIEVASLTNGRLVSYAYLFLKNAPGAKIGDFKRALLRWGQPKHLFYLATQSSSRKEIKVIEDKLIAIGSFQYIRMMAEQIELANIEKLEEFVLSSGNAKEIKRFAKSVKSSKSRKLAILF